MEYILNGTISSIAPTQTIPTKSGKQFIKREMVLVKHQNTPDGKTFETNVALTFAGETICNALSQYAVGQQVEVKFDVQSRQWNNKWYSEIRGYAIGIPSNVVQPQRQQPQPAKQVAQQTTFDDLPF